MSSRYERDAWYRDLVDRALIGAEPDLSRSLVERHVPDGVVLRFSNRYLGDELVGLRVERDERRRDARIAVLRDPDVVAVIRGHTIWQRTRAERKLPLLGLAGLRVEVAQVPACVVAVVNAVVGRDRDATRTRGVV